MVKYNMTDMSQNYKQVWIKKNVWEKVEKVRIRDETNSSLINFLVDFYEDNRPEKEIVIVENDKEVNN